MIRRRLAALRRSSALGLGVLVSLSVVGAGCGGGDQPPLPGSRPAAESAGDTPIAESPPHAHTHGDAPDALALKPTGIGSQAELDRALAKIEDPEARALFEMGFRSCFVQDRTERDYPRAVPAMESVLQRVPDFPPAYRVLAYAHLNINFDMATSTAYYEKAVELDPDYGEAHYALAFMLTQFDLERGRKHFERAMELGVEDERDLKGQFFQ